MLRGPDMAQYCVTHVRFKNDALTHVMMGLWNPLTRDWAEKPTPWPVIEVVDRILASDAVATLFSGADGTWEEGPAVRVLTLDNGSETLECIPNERPSRRLSHLPSF